MVPPTISVTYIIFGKKKKKTISKREKERYKWKGFVPR
jgi:hypothetical protein